MKICASLTASRTPSTLTSATSFCRLTTVFINAGTTLRTAWGRIAWRSVCHCVRPIARADERWLSGTESMPERKISAVYAE